MSSVISSQELAASGSSPQSPLSLARSKQRLPDQAGADPDLRQTLDEWMEALPCMALIERDGEITAANILARDFIGTGKGLPTMEIFSGAYPAAGDAHRQRFECLLLPPGGRPAIVWGAVQPFPAAGATARLILLMEPDVPVAISDPEGVRSEETAFLEDLFDSASEAMVIVQGTRIVRANREFVRMFGYSMEICLGATLYNLIIPEARHFESDKLLHSMESAGRAAMETVRRTSSGEYLDVSVSIARVRLTVDIVGLAVTYRDIRAQKQAEARLQYAALHDPLTGLANRILFFDRLKLTLARLERRPDHSFAVIFLDVDHFKQVNDGYGHAAGDKVLVTVTERLRRCLRPEDTVARLSGDEFALLLDEAGSTEDVARIARRIQLELQKAIWIEDREVFVSASMGITMGTTFSYSAYDILRDADHAMYRAKANGRACHEFFGLDPVAA